VPREDDGEVDLPIRFDLPVRVPLPTVIPVDVGVYDVHAAWIPVRASRT
jgi:hypothetical protein